MSLFKASATPLHAKETLQPTKLACQGTWRSHDRGWAVPAEFTQTANPPLHIHPPLLSLYWTHTAKKKMLVDTSALGENWRRAVKSREGAAVWVCKWSWRYQHRLTIYKTLRLIEKLKSCRSPKHIVFGGIINLSFAHTRNTTVQLFLTVQLLDLLRS